MKYHIGVKFAAILLCAACLLGAVGSAAGMIVLSELDLYNNTVDEYLEKDIRSSAQSFAREAALHYASVELGGCPEKLASNHYRNQWYYRGAEYGYAILDADGNVVAGSNTDIPQSGRSYLSYSVPVTGQYMHLVSKAPRQETDVEPEEPASPLTGAYGVYDMVSWTGEQVFGLLVSFAGEHPASSGYGSSDSMGLLVHETEDSITFYPDYNGEEYQKDWLAAGEINHITFQDESGQVIFEAAVPGHIDWEYTGEAFRFSLSGSEAGSTLTQVYLAEFYSMEDPEQTAFLIYGEEPVGGLFYDENGEPVVSLRSTGSAGVESSGEITDGWVSGIALYDENGALIAESRSTGLVTLSEDGVVYYHTAAPGSVPTPSQTPTEPEENPEEHPEEAPEEGEPENQAEDAQAEDEDPEHADEAQEQSEETTPETVAQTVPATVPETTEAPVPETTAATLPAEAAVASTSVSYEIVEVTDPETVNGKLLSEYDILSDTYYDEDLGLPVDVKYVYVPMPECTVELYVLEGTMRYESVYTLLRVVRNIRSDLFLILGVSLLLFGIGIVYLCCAAGHGPKQTETKAGGLSRMPLDLNLGLSAVAGTCLVFAAVYCTETLLMANIETGCLAVGGMGLLVSLLLVQLIYCTAAQFKTPGGYWWRNSVCGRLLIFAGKAIRWMAANLPGKILRLARFLWNLAVRICRFLWRDVLLRVIHGIGGLVQKFMALLPLIWQWLLVGGLLVLFCAIAAECGGTFLGILACLAVVLYVSYCFGILLRSAKKMGKGDLNTKVDDKHMVGCFKEFAGDLNDLADVAVVAAQKQLKSERMKTELITNVSHDIKTPLTSIINYVDLLQKPHTEEEGTMYLDVLARQSQRLKKLIEDLMDMSKASTGNMSVDITTLDAVEAVNQALGEFADKLDKAELIPVFRHGASEAMMQADGKLTWRVLSNLLGNAVKYAMPGTRLYIDLMEMEGNVVISLKNISRDELDVDADELMERFVRGDDSRNTEGSGLGLNIAKSLMELQKGQLQLLVDGDLFKVTLVFPGA